MIKPKTFMYMAGIIAALGVSTSAIASNLYSVEARKTPISDMVRMLAHVEGKNVVMPDNLSGNVTASFPNIVLQDAMKALLESNGYGIIVDGNTMRVAPLKAIEDLGKDLLTQTFNINYGKAGEIAAQAKSLISTRGSIMFDERTNAVTIRDTATHVRSIKTLIDNIDIFDQQVLIESKIVIATDDFTRNLGVQWGVNSAPDPSVTVNGMQGAGGEIFPGRRVNLNTPSSNPLSGVALALGPFSDTFIDVQLTAGEQKGIATILSRPSIITMNNRAATIRSGRKFYVKTSNGLTINTAAGAGGGGGDTGGGTGGGGNSNVNLTEIQSGITLQVTPQITGDHKVSLGINVSSAEPTAQLVDGIPSIDDNAATTTITVDDGGTAIIGGLRKQEKRKGTNGIPGLHRVPILGLLFGARNDVDNKRELLIFLTPSIVKEGAARVGDYNEQGNSRLETFEKKLKD